LRCRTVSEKLPKIPLFGTSLNHSLRFLGSQQHPQSGALLTSFSTFGTENSLAEINLVSTGEWGVINICYIFWVRNRQTLATLWTGALSCNKIKHREQNAVCTRASQMKPLNIYGTAENHGRYGVLIHASHPAVQLFHLLLRGDFPS
jgi:hypothetical protein